METFTRFYSFSMIHCLIILKVSDNITPEVNTSISIKYPISILWIVTFSSIFEIFQVGALTGWS